MKLTQILETCLYVEDLAKAEQFYSEILGFELYSKADGRHIFFRCGNSMLLLFDPRKTMEHGKSVPPHGAYGEGHVAFSVSEKELAAWREHLAAHNIAIESEITWPGGGKSIYFRDPDNNSLELATPQTWNFSQS